MEDYGVSANIFSNLILMNTQYVSAIYGELMESFGMFFRAFVTLYIVCTGYKFYKAESKMSVYDLLISCIIASSLYAVIFEWTWYYDFVIETAVNLTLDASSFFISSAPTSGGSEGFGNVHEVFRSLDQTVIDFFRAIEDLSPKGNFLTNAWRYFCFILAMIPLFTIFMAMYASFFVIFGIAFFSMFIFFIMGGPCFLFVAFKETRHIFITWCRGLLNYMLLAALAAIVMGICGKGISEAVLAFTMQSETVSIIVSDSYLKILIWCAFCLAMILKSPDFAAHMTGTIAGSTSGIAGALSAGTSALAGGLFVGSKMAGGAAGGAAWKGAKWGADKMGEGGMNALERLKRDRNAK
nr:type IV secretion system protein [Pseudodesulfovibrio sp.]